MSAPIASSDEAAFYRTEAAKRRPTKTHRHVLTTALIPRTTEPYETFGQGVAESPGEIKHAHKYGSKPHEHRANEAQS